MKYDKETDEEGTKRDVSTERSKAGTKKRTKNKEPTTYHHLIKIIIIIYHDFLPTPRRGSHVKSGKTHTQSSRYTP